MAKQTLTKPAEAAPAKVTESNPGAQLTSAFGDPIDSSALKPLYQSTPYVTFISSKAPSYAKLAGLIQDLQDSDPVLVMPEPHKPILLQPFRFYLVHCKAHYSEVDNTGSILRTTFDRDEARADRDLKEHIETVIVIALDGRLVAATCTFKTTKCGAAHAAVREYEDAKTAEWAERSPEHRAALCVPDPRFRFLTTVKLRSQTSRSSGFKYVAAAGSCKPAGVSDWQLLAATLRDEAFRDQSDRVVEAWKRRLDSLGR